MHNKIALTTFISDSTMHINEQLHAVQQIAEEEWMWRKRLRNSSMKKQMSA